MTFVLCLVAAFVVEEEPIFTEITIDPPFRRYLLANPRLMEVTGAKVIRLPDNHYLLFGVASTALEDGSVRERLRAEKVCRLKALRDLVGTTQGVQIASVQKAEDKVVVTLEKGKEKVTAVTHYLEITKARVEGVIKDMAVVGRWKSRDGKVFYLAIGAMCDKQGNLVGHRKRKDNRE